MSGSHLLSQDQSDQIEASGAVYAQAVNLIAGEVPAAQEPGDRYQFDVSLALQGLFRAFVARDEGQYAGCLPYAMGLGLGAMIGGIGEGDVRSSLIADLVRGLNEGIGATSKIHETVGNA